MKSKPLFYIILSYALIIEPILKILYFKYSTDFDWATIFDHIISRTKPREIYDFWFNFPLAGLALFFRINKWTFILFNACLLYIIVSFFTFESMSWPYYSAQPLAYNYIMVALSIIAVIVISLPDFKNPFFSSRLRWWETKERHEVKLSANCGDNNSVFATQILNISQTGAFLSFSELDLPKLTALEKLKLAFDYDDMKFDLSFKLARSGQVNGASGFGVEFDDLSFKQKLKLKKFIKNLGQHYR